MKDVYIITGATGGMGLDIAKNFDKKGRLILVDLDEEKLTKLQQELQKDNIDSVIIAADITNDADIDKMINTTKQLGNFKALIHTAGISNTMSNYKRVLEVNLLATQKLMNAFYKIANNSIVINISSSSAYLVSDSFLYNKTLSNPLSKNFFLKMSPFIKQPNAAYAMSKKGVNLITAKEVQKWADKKSRIVSVSPGAVKTPLLEKEMEDSDGVDMYINSTPVKRAGNPNEITNLVYEVINNEFINGVDLLIDGGVTANIIHNDALGIKASKVSKVKPLLLYMVMFLLIPFITIKVDPNILISITKDLLYLILPILVALVTIMYNKKKISLYLSILPVVGYLLLNKYIFNLGSRYHSIIYFMIAYITSLFISIISKSKK